MRKILRNGGSQTSLIYDLSLLFNQHSISYFLLIYDDKVKEDEIGSTYSTNGGEEECLEDIGERARRKETTRETNK
jgi:hypothetical protein